MIAPISAVIIAGTEEHNIRGCLESVGWTDHIVVVHSSHEDATEDIARSLAEDVIFHQFETFSSQREFALSHARHDWILSIDADERVTEGLRDEILSVRPWEGAYNGYLIPRKGYFLGKWMRHGGWWPDFQMRLFTRSASRVDTRLVHEGYLVTPPIAALKNPLDHFTDPTIRHHLRKSFDYTWLEAQERHKRVRASDLVLHPVAAFLQMYIGKQGWRDGSHGLAAALIHAANNLQQYLYMWEMGGAGTASDDRSDGSCRQSTRKEL